MCKETFLRLPEEKRARILDAAWDEFTAVSFVNASINRIIRRADIPRGSFYQYFDDKTDLFQYLMSQAHGQFMRAYRDILADSGGDVFRASLLCYDRFLDVQRRGTCFPAFERCIQIIRVNPGVDLESLGRVHQPDRERVMEAFLERMDPAPFRRTDRAFLVRVCSMAGMCFVSALIDSLVHPGKEVERREELSEELDILRRGSYRDMEKGASE